MPTSVGPHKFSPISRWRRNLCRACYLPKDEHPTLRYVTARALEDRSKAEPGGEDTT